MADLPTLTGNKTYLVRGPDGREWTFSPVETPDAAARIQQHLIEQFRLECHLMCLGAAPDAAGRALVEAAARITAKEFRFGSLRMIEAMADPEFKARVVQEALRPRQAAVTVEEARALLLACTDLVDDALAVLNPHTFRRLTVSESGAGPPNPKAPDDGATAPMTSIPSPSTTSG
jgi:hypothetical protein